MAGIRITSPFLKRNMALGFAIPLKNLSRVIIDAHAVNKIEDRIYNIFSNLF